MTARRVTFAGFLQMIWRLRTTGPVTLHCVEGVPRSASIPPPDMPPPLLVRLDIPRRRPAPDAPAVIRVTAGTAAPVTRS